MFPCRGSSPRAHLGAQNVVGKKLSDSSGKTFDVAMRYHKSGTFMSQPLTDAAAVERHNRFSLSHRFNPDQTKRFGPHRTEGDDFGANVRLPEVVSH